MTNPFSRRYLLAALILAGIIALSFLISVPHAREVSAPVPQASPAATSTPSVTLKDTFRKGVRTLTGTIVAPDACAPVSATSTLVGNASTTQSIRLDIMLAPTDGVCLELPTTLPFSTSLTAPKDSPVSIFVNGTAATTSAL